MFVPDLPPIPCGTACEPCQSGKPSQCVHVARSARDASGRSRALVDWTGDDSTDDHTMEGEQSE